MMTGRTARTIALISAGVMLCACGLLPKFTVYLPDRTVDVEIPGTGKILDKIDFDDHEVIRGSNNLVTINRETGGFDRITVMGSGEISLNQGNGYSLSITTDDNLLDYIQTKVENYALILGFNPDKAKDKDLRPSGSIIFDITIPDISSIEVYGSANIISENLELDHFWIDVYGSGDFSVDRFSCEQLSIAIFGAGDINIKNLEADSLSVSIPGVGKVRLAGAVDIQEVNLPGVGNYNAENLQSKTADIRIPGMSDAKIWVTDELYADIAGSGDLQYYGDPKVFHTGMGSGDLESLGNQ